MLMNFQVLEQSILDNVLEPAAAGRYATVGAQRQTESAEAMNELRKVMVFYTEGKFPKNAGASYGDVAHDVTFEVVMVVAAAAKADLSVLNNSSASDDDRAAALRAMREPSLDANRDMNELIAIVWQVLMDARNDQLGIKPPGDRPKLRVVANRWVSQVQKNDPLPEGEYVTLTATMNLTCRIEENIPGEDLTDPGSKIFESDLDINEDPVAQQGVEVTTP